jgi:hypothetical protein
MFLLRRPASHFAYRELRPGDKLVSLHRRACLLAGGVALRPWRQGGPRSNGRRLTYRGYVAVINTCNFAFAAPLMIVKGSRPADADRRARSVMSAAPPTTAIIDCLKARCEQLLDHPLPFEWSVAVVAVVAVLLELAKGTCQQTLMSHSYSVVSSCRITTGSVLWHGQLRLWKAEQKNRRHSEQLADTVGCAVFFP